MLTQRLGKRLITYRLPLIADTRNPFLSMAKLLRR
jgi:hypothetical protein